MGRGKKRKREGKKRKEEKDSAFYYKEEATFAGMGKIKRRGKESERTKI